MNDNQKTINNVSYYALSLKNDPLLGANVPIPDTHIELIEEIFFRPKISKDGTFLQTPLADAKALLEFCFEVAYYDNFAPDFLSYKKHVNQYPCSFYLGQIIQRAAILYHNGCINEAQLSVYSNMIDGTGIMKAKILAESLKIRNH